MNPLLRNLLAVIAGLVLGSVVNMSLIMLSGHVIPPPAGADLTTAEGLKAAMPLMETKHFLFPLLAHALGTLTGAWVCCRIAANRYVIWAMLIAGLFFIGGLMNIIILPSPLWFSVTDLLLAYFPMAWLGWKLTGRPKS